MDNQMELPKLKYKVLMPLNEVSVLSHVSFRLTY